MHVFVKTLSGAVQVLEFPGKEKVSVAELDQLLARPGLTLTHDARDKSDLYDEDIVTVVYTPDELNERDVGRLEDVFQRRISFFPEWKALIQSSGALVAGGSVLCALHDLPIHDFDIYVHQSKAQTFLTSLCSFHMMSQSDYHSCPAYDDSFMRRNHIIGRFHLVTGYSRYGRRDQNVVPRVTFDVMVIPDQIPLTSVVSHFDLTFCQVWWDGTRLDTTHVVDVRSKRGSLQSDYLSMYMACNSFTCKRIQKYLKRGFHVHIDTSHMAGCSEIHLEPVIKKNEEVLEHWMIQSVLRAMTYYIKEHTEYCRLLSLALFHNVPTGWTWTDFIEQHTSEVVCAFLYFFEENMLPFMDSYYHTRWTIPDILTDTYRQMAIESRRTIRAHWLDRLIQAMRSQVDQLNGDLMKNLIAHGHFREGERVPLYHPLQLRQFPRPHVVDPLPPRLGDNVDPAAVADHP